MNADAIILTSSSSAWHYGLTQRTINSLIHNNRDVNINIVVVESDSEAERNGFMYPECTVLVPKITFNYNRFMRIGLDLCCSETVLLCNNDLIFLEGSVGKLIQAMLVHGCPSASPYEPNHHPRAWPGNPPGNVVGHRVTNHVCGWCVCASRIMLSNPDFLDERFAFWHQDVDYACTLLEKGLPHVLVRDSHVRHEGGCSHSLLGDSAEAMTNGMHQLAVEKWKRPDVDWMALQEENITQTRWHQDVDYACTLLPHDIDR